MKIAIPKEIIPGERRVALVPRVAQELIQANYNVLLEKTAGEGADYLDGDYQQVVLCNSTKELYQDADVILKVQTPTEAEIAAFKEGAVLIGFLAPNRYPERIQALKEKNITSFAMEYIPRISRAQSMDALSSQASIAGYKATLIAANSINRFFPMLTTAAGTIRPVNVLIIGTGVAGLQAIATARRLGAIVKAYDIRSATKEQVESLGATMIDLKIEAEGTGGYARELTAEEKQKQQDALAEAVAKSEVVICTAQIPGKPAPKIITEKMVASMPAGSVIVDVAAETGGNCELTKPGEVVNFQNVSIYGPLNLPSMLARDASNMYAKNVVNFMKLLIKDGALSFDWNDPILAQSVVTHAGEIKSR
ncbi:MAG: Re/Si-specific NAD(P)(+) transhydrogenase subunit alpha [Gammaproteobacteria bacterium]